MTLTNEERQALVRKYPEAMKLGFVSGMCGGERQKQDNLSRKAEAWQIGFVAGRLVKQGKIDPIRGIRD